MFFGYIFEFFWFKKCSRWELSTDAIVFFAFLCVFFYDFWWFWGPILGPKIDQKSSLAPKGSPRGAQEGPRRLPGGPRDRFLGHLGLIWGAFWSHLGAILEQIAVNEVDLIACGLFRFFHQLFLFLFLLAAWYSNVSHFLSLLAIWCSNACCFMRFPFPR